MFDDVESKIKRRNQILFNHSSETLQELKYRLSALSHIEVVLWAFSCCKDILNELNSKYPKEEVFDQCYSQSWKWAKGQIKMKEAKAAILSCHRFAKTIDSKQDIALVHALGQGCSSVHVPTHAIGLAFYELTSIVIAHDYRDYQEEVKEKILTYDQRLESLEVNDSVWTAHLLK